MLQDLVGMEGLEGDMEEVELGSNYPYADEFQLKVPSTNTTSNNGVSNLNNKLFLPPNFVKGDKNYNDLVDLEMSNIQASDSEKGKKKKKRKK